jgi:hypothetical protein
MIGKAAFFDPLADTSPTNRVGPAIFNTSIAFDSYARG